MSISKKLKGRPLTAIFSFIILCLVGFSLGLPVDAGKPVKEKPAKTEPGGLGTRGGGELLVCPAPEGVAEGYGARQTRQTTGFSAPFEDTFFLHSNPGATQILYIDFDGYEAGWATLTAFSIDGDTSTFTEEERTVIQETWFAVSEDYLPFNIDVTTEEPPPGWLGQRAVVDGSNLYESSWAYVGDWAKPNDQAEIAYCYHGDDSWQWIENSVSHEVGHTLDLHHDGRGSVEYYQGHGAGDTRWCPTMGWGDDSLNIWSIGDYNGSTNTQDDLAVITAVTGVNYRADDHGSNTGSATAIDLPVTMGLVAEGLIERNDDLDFFSFTTSGGDVSISINEDIIIGATNLDVEAKLYNAGGSVIATSNPVDRLWATFNETLAAGTYYVSVDGTGMGDPSTDPPSGYSDYGILGYYSIKAQGAVAAVGIAGDVSQSSYEIYHLAIENSGLGLYDPSKDQGIRNRNFQTGSMTGTLGNQEAQIYLVDQFTAMGLTVSVQGAYKNVVAELTGTTRPNDVYIYGAHYDHLSGDRPGGDDNASGTAALLEAARVLSGHQYEATIRFVAFNAEENGLLGSADYVANISGSDNVIGMINMDMILRPGSDEAPGRTIDFEIETDNWLTWSNAFIQAAVDYVPSIAVGDLINAGASSSDNDSFSAAGIPSLLIIENSDGDWYPPNPVANTYYHGFDDASDRLANDPSSPSGVTYDFPFATDIVRIGVSFLDQEAVRDDGFTGDPVPDVVDTAQATAESTITGAGFVVGTISNSYSGSIAAGNVISQNPSAGTNALPGASVDIEVSLGVLTVSVPNVVGSQQAAAESVITGALLTVGNITSVFSTTIPAGEVISQDPAAGTNVVSDTAVNMVVSAGEQMVNVPNVVGSSEAAAGTTLSAALLNVGTVTTAGSESVAAGDVISQNPGSGASVAAGSSVDLVVSIGDTTAPNPDPMTWAAVPSTGGGSGVWINQDIGAVAAAGSVSENNGTYTVTASGKDIWLNDDEFHYVYQSLSGDGEIVARVVSVSNAHDWSKGGLMIRETLDVGSKHAMVIQRPDNQVSNQQRLTTDGASTSDGLVGGSSANYLRLVRTGNVFTSFYSTTSATGPWTAKGTTTVSMATDVYIGLAVTSHNDGAITTAVFDSVSLTSAGDPETEITMAATTASDVNGVEYYFANTSGPGNDSGWQDSASYTDAGLQSGTEYTYTVVARDKSINQNVTGASVAASATTTGTPPGDPVPDVVGLAQATAESTITGAGFVVGTVSSSNSDTVAVGNVISSNPVAGTSLPAGSSIDIEVSLGVLMVTVPDVTGLAQASAEANITAAQLAVGVVSTAYSNTVAVGNVISQNPAAGSSVAHDTTVDIEVSLGVEPVTVPNVVGSAQAAAEASITGANLTVGSVSTSYSDTVAAGLVISQSPAGGASVAPSTSVDIEVSLGVEMVTVPNVVGAPQATAEASITASNLTVGTVTSINSSTIPAGIVISQSVTAGSSVVHDTAVDLVVSAGEQMVSVPNVVGSSQASATSTLSAASLNVGTVTGAGSNTVPAGEVISQNPGSGASVAAGSSVDLVVSLGDTTAPNPDPMTWASVPTAGTGSTPVVSESFEYSDGSDLTGNGGVGFSGAWSTTSHSSNPIWQVHAPGLTFIDGSSKVFAVAGNRPQRGGEAGRAEASRALSSASQSALFGNGSTMWFSVLYESTSNSISAFVIGTDTFTPATHWTYTAYPSAGEGFGFGSTQDTLVTAIALDNDGTWQEVDSSVDVTTTKLIVGKIEWNANGTDDVLSLYNVTDLSVEPTTPIATVTADLNQSNFDTTAIFHNVAGASFDEIRMGTSFGSLVGGDSETEIAMTATTASDVNGVEYNFTNTSGPGNDSGWQDSASYTDAGLQAGTEYTYTVVARDKSSNQNVTGASVAASATTSGTAPGDPVPNVVGMAQASAESTITGAGFTVGTVSSSNSDTVAAGDVISSNPVAGTSLPAGSSVNIEVSLGVLMVTVPDVTGLAQATAEANITAAQLAVGSITTSYSNTVAIGNVISQSPSAGSNVVHDTAVDIEVSLGVEPVTVPNVVGSAQATAEASITGASLTVGTITSNYSASVAVGDVISQSPSGGSSVAPGTSINLEISLGISPAVPENVVLPANGGLLESFTAEYGAGWVASDLNNGVTNEDGWASKANPSVPQEFVFSFSGGNSATLNDAVIHGGTGEGQYYSKDVEVWTSFDGTNYTLAASGALANSSNDSISLSLGGVSATRVKLVVTSGHRTDYWELSEFVVNGIVD